MASSVVENEGAVFELVSDEEAADDKAHLLVRHHEETAPPLFEGEVAFRFRIDVRVEVVPFFPEGVGGIEIFHVGNQDGAVKEPLSQVAEEGCQPGAPRQASW